MEPSRSRPAVVWPLLFFVALLASCMNDAPEPVGLDPFGPSLRSTNPLCGYQGQPPCELEEVEGSVCQTGYYKVGDECYPEDEGGGDPCDADPWAPG